MHRARNGGRAAICPSLLGPCDPPSTLMYLATQQLSESLKQEFLQHSMTSLSSPPRRSVAEAQNSHYVNWYSHYGEQYGGY